MVKVRNVLDTMKDVFENVQFNKTCHKKYQEILTSEYKKVCYL